MQSIEKILLSVVSMLAGMMYMHVLIVRITSVIMVLNFFFGGGGGDDGGGSLGAGYIVN